MKKKDLLSLFAILCICSTGLTSCMQDGVNGKDGINGVDGKPGAKVQSGTDGHTPRLLRWYKKWILCKQLKKFKCKDMA